MILFIAIIAGLFGGAVLGWLVYWGLVMLKCWIANAKNDRM